MSTTTNRPAHTDAYWFHYSALDNVKLVSEYHGAANAGAVASNMGADRLDVERYMQQMIGWGWLEQVEPQWEMPYPTLWVKATV